MNPGEQMSSVLNAAGLLEPLAENVDEGFCFIAEPGATFILCGKIEGCTMEIFGDKSKIFLDISIKRFQDKNVDYLMYNGQWLLVAEGHPVHGTVSFDHHNR